MSSRSTTRVRGVSGLRVGHPRPGRCSTRGVERAGRMRISIPGRSAARLRWALASVQGGNRRGDGVAHGIQDLGEPHPVDIDLGLDRGV
jgi:hypothetical protein